MAKILQEEHFGINGENYEMLNTAKVIAEGDYVGEQFIDDVYEYTLSSQDIVVANEVVTNEWFHNLATLPQNKQKSRLNEWLKLGVFEYIMNSCITSAVRDILTPKEYSDLLHIMKNGRDLEAECMRLAYKLSAVYQDDLYMWYADNFGSFNESLEEGIDEQDLSFKINKKVVTFHSDGEEVNQFKIATISNMADRDLFDLVYAMAQEYVPNIELLDVADFAVMLQMEVAKVLNKGGDVLESVQGLTEDEPQVENPQQFDVMGDIVNGNNIAAEKRFDSNQNQETQEFDNDGD